MATLQLLKLAVFFILCGKGRTLMSIFRVLAWPPSRARFDKIVNGG
jgi:hypothetical protein